MDMSAFMSSSNSGPSNPTASNPARPPSNKKRPRAPTASDPAAAGSRGMPAAAGPDSKGDLSKVRAFAACRACRQKKVKCLPGPATTAGGAAACQQCTMTGAECEYQPTRDRAAYSRAYVQDLSGRVQALESMQQRLLPLLNAFEDGKLPEGMPAGAVPAMPPPLPRQSTPDEDDDRSARSQTPNEDDEEYRRFLRDESGNYRWIGPSNTFSLLDSFGGDGETKGERSGGRVTYAAVNETDPEASPPDNHPYFAPVAGSGKVRVLPGVEEVTFPPRADAESFVDAYFAEIHPVLPIFIEPDFRRRFHALMDKVAVGDFSRVRGGFISVVMAVFALGERVLVTSAAWHRERAKQQSGKEGGDAVLPGEAEAGVIWFERSQIIHFTTIRDIDLHQVQCLTLLAAFQASVNAMPMAWLLASQAVRIAQDIGLHRSASNFKVSFAVKQLGARCWWAIYGLERLVSITLGRPLCVDDQDIDVPLPAEADDASIHAVGDALTEEAMSNMPEEPLDCTMSGFVALTKLCKIAGRVVHLLYRPNNGRNVSDQSWGESQQRTIDKLDRLLRDWLETEVPKKYKDASSSRPVSLMSAVLSNSYFAVLLTLHRNLLPSNPDFPRPKPPPNSQSLSHCVEAARSVIHIAATSRVVVPVSHHLAVFCQYLWSSAVILLLCEVRAREQVVVDAVGQQVESANNSLRCLQPVWPGARKLLELLHDVEQRTKEVRAAAAARPSKKRKPSSNLLENGKGKVLGKTEPPSASPPINAWNTSTQPFEQHGRGRQMSAASGTSQTFAAPTMPPTSSLDMPAFNLFDVGDMTFDGLEMLSAFTSDAWAAPPALGSTMSQSPASTTPRMGSLNNTAPGSAGGPQAQNTNPNQPGLRSPTNTIISGSGDPTPSPAGANNASAWFTQGLGPPVQTPAPGPTELAEMWAQIAGNSFDWQADPNVPFNI